MSKLGFVASTGKWASLTVKQGVWPVRADSHDERFLPPEARPKGDLHDRRMVRISRLWFGSCPDDIKFFENEFAAEMWLAMRLQQLEVTNET